MIEKNINTQYAIPITKTTFEEKFRNLKNMKPSIYIDTSVVGGCFDQEFEEWSLSLFSEFISGTKIMMISDLVVRELELAKAIVKNQINKVPLQHTHYVFIDEDVVELARIYIDEGALTKKSYEDALHIALATIHNATVLASWNFKHIVNLDKIRLYNSINLKRGYHSIEIRTPREILKK